MSGVNVGDQKKELGNLLKNSVISQWSCPYTVFSTWMSDASDKNITEPNAMTIATVDDQGRPSARMVLLKEMKHQKGFVFFTNYGSRKAGDMEKNPNVALVFYWDEEFGLKKECFNY